MTPPRDLDAYLGFGRSSVIIAGPVLETALGRLIGTKTLKVSVRGRKCVASVSCDAQHTTAGHLRLLDEAEGGAVGEGDLAYLEIIAVRIGIVRQDAVRHVLSLRYRLTVVLGRRRVILARNNEGNRRHVGTAVAIADGVRHLVDEAVTHTQTLNVAATMVRDVARRRVGLDDAAGGQGLLEDTIRRINGDTVDTYDANVVRFWVTIIGLNDVRRYLRSTSGEHVRVILGHGRVVLAGDLDAYLRGI